MSPMKGFSFKAYNTSEKAFVMQRLIVPETLLKFCKRQAEIVWQK